MEDERSNGAPRGDCGSGEFDRNSGSCGTSAGCGCGAAAVGRSRVKSLIAAIVIISAIGVGAYSLMAGRAADPTEQAVPCGAASTRAAGKTSEHSCCAGGVGKTAASCAAKSDSAACRVPSDKK